MPHPGYMDTQEELKWSMRGVLNDWLVQVHQRFKLLPETLLLAFNITDRFLSARTVSLEKLQLAGATSLWMAAKYEEIYLPSLNNFVSATENCYDKDDVLRAERYMFKTLDWNLSYPNPLHFLRRASKADDYDIQVRPMS